MNIEGKKEANHAVWAIVTGGGDSGVFHTDRRHPGRGGQRRSFPVLLAGYLERRRAGDNGVLRGLAIDHRPFQQKGRRVFLSDGG